MRSCTRLNVFFLVVIPLTWLLLSVSIPSPVALASPDSSSAPRQSHKVMDNSLAKSAELREHVNTGMGADVAGKHSRGVNVWGGPPLLQDEKEDNEEDCSDHEEDGQDEGDGDDYSDDNEEDGTARASSMAGEDTSAKAEREKRQQEQDIHVSAQGPHKKVIEMLHPLLFTPPREGLPLMRGSGTPASSMASMSTSILLNIKHRTAKHEVHVETSTKRRHGASTSSVDRHPDSAMTSSPAHHVPSASTRTSDRLPECTEGVFPPGNATRRSIQEQSEDRRDVSDQQPCAPPQRSSTRHSWMSSRKSCAGPSSAHAPRRSSLRSHRTATVTTTPTRSAASHPSSWTQTVLTLADDTVQPERVLPEEVKPRLEKRHRADGAVETTDDYGGAVTAALEAFLEQDGVRTYLMRPHYVFVVSPNSTTGSIDVSPVYFGLEEHVTHKQLYRAALNAISGSPWPRWPGPRQRVKSTANATWTILHTLPVLLLIAIRIKYAGRPLRTILLAFFLILLCEWLILLDHNTKLSFDVPIDDSKEGLWYLLYFSEWTLATFFAPVFCRWLDARTGGRLKALLRRVIPAAAVAALLASRTIGNGRGRGRGPQRPSPRRRNASNPLVLFDLERIRGTVSVIPGQPAIPLVPLGPPGVVVAAPEPEQDEGTQGRARRATRAAS